MPFYMKAKTSDLRILCIFPLLMGFNCAAYINAVPKCLIFIIDTMCTCFVLSNGRKIIGIFMSVLLGKMACNLEVEPEVAPAT